MIASRCAGIVRPVRKRVSRPRRRRGFTLVEVMLALALSVVVLAAISTALTTYGRLTTSGRDAAERTRLAQAVLRAIERDLRSVVFRKPEAAVIDPMTGQAASTSSADSSGGAEGSSGGPTGSGSLSAASSLANSPEGLNSGLVSDEAAVVDPAAAFTGNSVGLTGDSTTLVVHVSRPSRDLAYGALGSGSRTSDLLSVSWFLAVANGGGLQGAVGNLASGGSVLRSTDSGTQGLARIEGDQMSISLADQSGDTRSLAEAAEIVAEEVNSLEFRYFDGVSWLTEWDSAAYGSLPKAVEILIGFRSGKSSGDASRNAAPSEAMEESSEFYRLVVALPLSQYDAVEGGL